MTIAARVTSFVGATFLSCVLMLGLVVQSSLSQHFDEQAADELHVVSASVERALQGTTEKNYGDALHEHLRGAVSGHHGMYYAVFNSNGEKLFSIGGPDFSELLSNTAPVEMARKDNLYH